MLKSAAFGQKWTGNGRGIPNRDYVAESQELRRKTCDVVIDEQGKQHFITNGKKMYDALIAPRLVEEAARAKSRARHR